MNSPASKGGVESYIAQLGGNVRALKLVVQERWSVSIGNVSAIFPWIVRHASWLYNRYQPLSDGITVFEKLHKEKYHGDVQPFSRPVLIRMPYATSLPKAEPRWVLGVWLGKHEQSDAHLVGTPQGVLVGRSVRCVDDDAQTRQCFDQMTWTPWIMHASSDTTSTGAPALEPMPNHR